MSTYRPDRLRRRTPRTLAAVPAKEKTTVKVKRVHKQLVALKLILRSLGLEYVEEYRFHPVRMWRFDLAVPALKFAIEYQGHGQTGGKTHVGGHASITGLAGDCEKDLHALLCGWRVIKFTALHFTPGKRRELKLTAPLDAVKMMVENIETNTSRRLRSNAIVRRCVSHHCACDCREARFRELLEDTIRCHSTPDNGNYNECEKAPCAWCEEAKSLIHHGPPDGLILRNDKSVATP